MTPFANKNHKAHMGKEIKLITNTKHSTMPEQETMAKIRRNKNQDKLKEYNKESLK